MQNPASSTIDVAIDEIIIRVSFVVVLGSFMSILDTTVVNVALQRLASEFDASLAITQWVVTSYMLALATVIPLAGWACDRFGTKRVYITALAVFTFGSLLCSLAWSSASLLAFRILQGLGGGLIMPVGMTAVGHAAGPNRVGRAMTSIGVPMLFAPIVGPAIGGWLVDAASWRWIFLINLPVGVLAMLSAGRFLVVNEYIQKRSLDIAGLAMLSPGLALFVYGLAETAEAGYPEASIGTLSLAVGLFLIAGFITHSLRTATALIDVRLFGFRTVGAAAAVTFLFGIAFLGNSLLIPLYFQVVRGETAAATGMLMAIQGFGAMLSMPVAGRLTESYGSSPVIVSGLALTSVALLILSGLTAGTAVWQIEAMLFTLGLGMGATMMPAQAAALTGVERHETARVTAGMNVVQRVGSSVGTALIAVILTRNLSHQVPGFEEVATSLDLLHSVPAIGRLDLADREARAFGDTFLWSFGFAFLAIGAAALLPRNRPPRDRALMASGD